MNCICITDISWRSLSNISDLSRQFCRNGLREPTPQKKTHRRAVYRTQMKAATELWLWMLITNAPMTICYRWNCSVAMLKFWRRRNEPIMNRAMAISYRLNFRAMMLRITVLAVQPRVMEWRGCTLVVIWAPLSWRCSLPLSSAGTLLQLPAVIWKSRHSASKFLL